MEITLLGTAACEGIPSLFCNCEICRGARERGGKDIRTRSQIAIDNNILIDLPPDFYMHMLNNSLDASKFANILVTHSHFDHFSPLDIYNRRFGFAYGLPEKTLNIYGSNIIIKKFMQIMEIYGRLDEKVLTLNEVKKYQTIIKDGYTIIPLPAVHTLISKEQSFIYAVEKNNKWFLAGNDTDVPEDEVFNFLKQKKIKFGIVCLDCTRGLAQKDKGCHMCAADVIYVKQRFIDDGLADEKTRFVATHFSHNGKGLYSQLENKLSPYSIETAYDGMHISI